MCSNVDAASLDGGVVAILPFESEAVSSDALVIEDGGVEIGLLIRFCIFVLSFLGGIMDAFHERGYR